MVRKLLYLLIVLCLCEQAISMNGHKSPEIPFVREIDPVFKIHYQEESQLSEAFYQLLDQSFLAIIPLSNFCVGASLGGAKWAFGGLLLGNLDIFLQYLSLQEEYYLSAAFLGAASLDPLQLPYHLQHWAGAIGGLGLASGYLNPVREYMEGPLHSAINGYVYKGGYGGAVGGAAALLDEALKFGEWTNAGYAERIFQSLAESKALGMAAGMLIYVPKIGGPCRLILEKAPQGSVELVAAFIFFWHSVPEEKDSSLSIAKTGDEVSAAFEGTLLKLLNHSDLASLMRQQKIIIIAIPLLSSQFSVQLQKYCQSFDTQLAAFKDITVRNRSHLGNAFFESISMLAIFLIPYIGESFMTDLVDDYMGRYLTLASKDALMKKLIEGEMLLKLARDNETAALIDTMDTSLYALAATGEKLLSKIAGSQVKGVYGICLLSRYNALDFSVLAEFLDTLLMQVGTSLTEWEYANEQAILPLASKISTLQKELHKNPRDIVYAGKQEFLHKKISEIEEELRILYRKKSILNLLSQSFFTAKELFLNIIIKYGYIVRKILGEGLPEAEHLPFAQYSAVTAAGQGVLESHAWYSQQAGPLMAFNKAVSSLNRLVDAMDQPLLELDSLEYRSDFSDQTAILLEDFSVGHEGGDLLQPQSFNIPQGIYVVSGASGSGKTSFLSKIQGIQSNRIWAKGRLCYLSADAQWPKIHQSTQVDYFVPYTKLIELILGDLLPAHKLCPEHEQKLMDLLLEIEIDNKGMSGLVADLYEEKDWMTVLSGGQKRKISIINAILKSPDILILDEVFNGLDALSVQRAQRMLMHYLPNSLMLIVDHNYNLNDYDLGNGQHFYKKRLHLEGQILHWFDL